MSPNGHIRIFTCSFASRKDRPSMTSCMLTPAGILKHCRHILKYVSLFCCCSVNFLFSLSSLRKGWVSWKNYIISVRGDNTLGTLVTKALHNVIQWLSFDRIAEAKLANTMRTCMCLTRCLELIQRAFKPDAPFVHCLDSYYRFEVIVTINFNILIYAVYHGC